MSTHPPHETLVDLLRLRACEQPSRIAYIFLADGETESASLTYLELDRRARAIAAQLQALKMEGQRALLIYHSGLDYVAAFFGCLYAGVVAVPAYPPRKNQSALRLKAIASDSEAGLMLTGASVISDVRRRFLHDFELADVQWLTTDDLDESLSEQWQPCANISADTLALIQYTSGSTAEPRGVMVSHANLLHNQAFIQETYRLTPDGVGVGWLPLYHDMGLTGNVIQPVYVGGLSVFMPPAAFLQRPYRWLKAISDYKATAGGGPNFAYDLCVRKVTPEQRETLNLGSWAVAFNGAEPLRPETLESFAKTFEPCGFQARAFFPCYGLAEATLMVACRTSDLEPATYWFERAGLEQNVVVPVAPGQAEERGARGLVSCGPPVAEHQVIIVDPETERACAPDRVGEIWVSGPSVAQGYLNHPESTRRTFRAHLADTGQGPFLRTGDLGFFHQGELFLTGRLKDLIIIHGRNHYPQDLEKTAERCHHLLRQGSGAAFAVEVGGAERLVIVQEVERHYQGVDLDRVIEDIRQSVSRDHEIACHAIVLVKQGGIPKTTSGKIQRGACRAAFLAGSLTAVREWRAAESDPLASAAQPAEDAPAADDGPGATRTSKEVEAWLVAQIARLLKLSPDQIDTGQQFTYFGLGSIEAVSLAADLEDWLGRSLPSTLAWDYPTIKALAEHLGADEDGPLDAAPEPEAPPVAEPIAVVGYGCRFPGADGPEAFWQMLREGTFAVSEVPPERWDLQELFDPNPDAPGKMSTRWGGFLKHVDMFDPHFFGISPREATQMDPQQRLLAEVVWEAFEHAGLPPERIGGSQTGVFIGISSFDWSQLHAGDLERIDGYTGTGNAHSIAANRLSYLFDLKGPSVAIDTACSSSLVAVHFACQSLRSGESDMALAGGVNLLLSPEATITFSKARMMAGDGRCKTFDAEADGYARGEGCGIVVLKRVSDALRDGDNILGLIRGSAVNQDGRSKGLTAPHGPAQQAVIRQALTNASLSPELIDYVEVHGTGTPLGDPIEVQALTATFGPAAAPGRVCVLGSLKTNIGHLEAAAGIAGLIKVLLCLQHGEIPPHLHLKSLNPHISLEDTPLVIATERREWAANGRPRFAGVSSFGFGGTNAHVVVQGTAAPPVAQAEQAERPLHLLTLSARSEPALRALAQRYAQYIDTHPWAALADICHTANAGRATFNQRLAVTAATAQELREKLETFAQGKQAADLTHESTRAAARPKIAFLYTGQGAQYPGMGRQLYETEPTFREALDRCADILNSYLDRPLLSVIFPDAGDGEAAPLHETVYTQPALFALEYALGEMWRSWGITPDVVLGHSVGEYVAACVAGVFSLGDGLRLIAERARLMQSLPPTGTMAAVLAEEERVAALVGRYGGVSVAAVNGPKNTVISGQAESVAALVEVLKAQGITAHPLKVSHAFHSPLMEPILERFTQIAREVEFAPPRVPLVSNLTGQLWEPGQAPDAAYWTRHLRETVRFSEGLRSASALGCEVFLELGPNPTLTGLGKRCLDASNVAWLPSMQAGQEDWRVALNSLGALRVRGAEVDWAGFDRHHQRRRLALPTYPFERTRHWLEPTPADARKTFLSGNGAQAIPLLGRRISAAQQIFESQLGAQSLPYLADHRIQGSILVPASAYVELALAAAEATGVDNALVSEIELQAPLFLSAGERRTAQVTLAPNEESGTTFTVHSLQTDGGQAADAWTLHAHGKLHSQQSNGDGLHAAGDTLEEIRLRCADEVGAKDFYSALHARGYHYGPAFRGVARLWWRDGEALAEIQVPPSVVPEIERYRLHPAVLDACFQAMAATQPDAAESDRGGLYLPVGIAEVRFYARPAAHLWSHARLHMGEGRDANLIEGEVRLLDEAGRLVAHIKGFRAQLLESEKKEAASKRVEDWLYEVRWQPKPLPEPEAQAAHLTVVGSWLVFADGGGVGEEVARLLAARGQRCVLIRPGDTFEQLGADLFSVRPAHAEDMRALLGAALGAGRPPCRGVVHLWSLDAPRTGETTLDGLRQAQDLGCISTLNLLQALIPLVQGQRPVLCLGTRGAHALAGAAADSVAQSPLCGLGRVIAHEHPEVRCVGVELENGEAAATAQTLFREVMSPDGEDQIAYRAGERHVARLARYELYRAEAGADDGEAQAAVKLPVPQTRHFRLELTEPGTLDNLILRPSARRAPGPGEVELRVRAVGLNFRDVMKALGIYPSSYEDFMWLGDECAGRVVALGEGVEDLQVGDEVIAIAPACFGSYATTSAAFVVPRPRHVSDEEAATISIAFLTAYYGLCHLARLAPGERVLIHAAAGGVGLAAVQIAKRCGAEIFATAGSPEKRSYLQSLGVKHVMDSRSLDFAEQVSEATGGRGVDVVLNSLAGAAISRSLSALAPYGRFVEIGKRDIFKDSRIGLRPFQKNLSFFAVDMDRLFRERPEFAAGLLREVMRQVANGTFEPLPYQAFRIEEAQSAFRYMAQTKNVGKVVVSIPAEAEEASGLPAPGTLRADASYLVTGGLGGLGLLLARWMVKQGARSLVLLGRSAPSEAARAAIAEMERAGASVRVAAADVARQESLARVLSEVAGSAKPLRGVVHAAGLLDDGILLQLDAERMRRVLAPKVYGAWNLHALTAGAPLDFFILFSSVASLLGSPGQGNYAAANAFLDALAHHRRGAGLPAVSVNWGPWAEVGMAARTAEEGHSMLPGIDAIAPEKGLEALEQLLSQEAAQVAVMPINWPQWQKLYAGQKFPLLEGFAVAQSAGGQRESGITREAVFALPPEARQQALESYLQKEVAQALQLDPSLLDIEQPLNTVGLDSLMSIEMKNRIEADLDVTFSIVRLVQGTSITALAAHLIELLGDAPGDAEQTPSTNAIIPGGVEPNGDEVSGVALDQLSDHEVDALLTDLLNEQGLRTEAPGEVVE